MSRIIRVFPRRTRATPTDPLAYTGLPTFFAQADAVHISVAFTYDLPAAERLEREWRHVAPTTIGGPATGMAGGDFEPGVYLAPGYTITSRGCPNACWFCSVWRREGRTVRELPIRDGWNVLDDNLLACSREHILAVVAMLAGQPHRPEFTGGLEPARVHPWNAELLASLRPRSLFLAYDTPQDEEEMRVAVSTLFEAGISRAAHVVRCYVLCGYPGDTMAAADARMRSVLTTGALPMAMLYRDETGRRAPEWVPFARRWARPTIVASKATEGGAK